MTFDKTPGVDTAVLEAVAAEDAKYFANHPTATVRVRDFVPGEGPAMYVPPNHRAVVHVTQVVPGFRLRAILIEGPRGRPFSRARGRGNWAKNKRPGGI
jgi:hypothetical protein